MSQIVFHVLYFTVFYWAHSLVDTVNVSSEMSAELKFLAHSLLVFLHFKFINNLNKNTDNVCISKMPCQGRLIANRAGRIQWFSHRLNDQTVMVQLQAQTRYFYTLHNMQTNSNAHQTSLKLTISAHKLTWPARKLTRPTTQWAVGFLLSGELIQALSQPFTYM